MTSGLSLRATVTITSTTDASGGRTLSVAIASVTGTSLLDLAGVVTVTGGTGTVVSDARGTRGGFDLSGVTLSAASFASFTATSFGLQFGGGTTAISIGGAQLTVAGVVLEGRFTLDRTGGVTRFAFTDMLVSQGGSTLVTGGEGGFVVAPGTSGGGVAGYLTGSGSGTFGGVALSGTVFLRVNTTLRAVHESIEVGGKTVSVDFDDPQGATVLQISLTDATLTIGNFLVVQGSFTWSDCATAAGCTVAAGQGVRIFVGNGPAFFADGSLNPLATGVLVSNATIGLVRTTSSTYAVTASGTVSLVGVDGVTLGGTVVVRWNDTGAAVDETVAIPGSSAEPVRVTFPTATAVKSFSLTGATIGILGQTLTADLSVSRTAAGETVLGFAQAGLTLGPVTLSNGSGVFVLGRTGLAGRVSGTLALAVPGVTFGAGLSLAVNTTGAEVGTTLVVGETSTRLDLPAGPYLRFDGTAVTLTVLGQSITADVAVVRTGTTTTIGLRRVSLGFATSGGYGAALTQGSGVLVVGATGVAGRLAGQVSLILPAGVSARGTLALALNTGTSAVSAALTVGGEDVAVDLPAGPYLRFEAEGLELTVGGQRLTGDFSVEKIGTVVRLAGAHLSLDLGGLLTVREGSALVLLTGTGLAASISGTVALTVPGVQIGGTLAVQVNTTGGVVAETFSVAGVPTRLDLTSFSGVRVVGTGLTLGVLGQTLTGDLTITRTTDAAGRTTLRLVGEHLALVMGAGAATASFTQNGSAELTIGPAGITARLGVDVALSVPGVEVGGTVHLVLDSARGHVSATGPTVTLSVLGQTLSGAFIFEQTGTGAARVVRVALADVTLALGPATVSNGTGVLLLTSGGLAGRLSADLALTDTGVLDLRGSFALALNTTGTAVHEIVTVGGGDVVLDLPAGPYVRVSGTDVVITAGGQQLSGDVTVEKSGSTVRVTAADVRMQLGDGRRVLVRLTNGSADLLLGSTLTGTVSGTVELVGIPDVTLGGTFTATFAATSPTLVISGEDVVLSVKGQSLTAEKLEFFRGTDSVTLRVTNGELAFTDATGRSLVRATAVSGQLTFVSRAADGRTTPTVVVGTGGVYGGISGSIAVDLPGVTLTATTIAVELNTTAIARSVNGADLASGVIRLVATAPLLTIAGQRLGADKITVTRSPIGSTGFAVRLTLDNLDLELGGVVDVDPADNWDGDFLITPAGIAGTVSGSLGDVIDLGDSITLAGTASLRLNTSATAVDLTSGSLHVTLPAGPYLRIEVGNGTAPVLTVGTIAFSGTILVERSVRPGFVPATTFTATLTERTMSTGDLDRDGFVDLVVGTTGGYVVQLGRATAGTGGAPDTVSTRALPVGATMPSLTTPVVGTVLIDLDGDGWLDVVLAGETTAVLRNRRGIGSAWLGFELVGTAVATTGATSLAVGDVTGDGFADVVVGASSGGTRVLTTTRTTGGTTAAPTYTLTGLALLTTYSDAGTRDVLIADLDNDGRLDLVLAASGGDHYRLNTAPGTTWSLATDSAITGAAQSVRVAAGDLNGDGLVDVVGGAAGAAPTVYYNRGLVSSSGTATTTWQGLEKTALPGAVQTPTGITVGDVDGDGRRDVLVATAAGVLLYRNTGCTDGRACFAAPRLVASSPNVLGVALVNVDTDTDADLITFGGAPRWFQQSPVSTTIVGLSGITVSLGTAKLEKGQGALVVFGDGVAGTFSGSFAAGSGSGSVGVSASVRFNSTPHEVDEIVTVGGVEIPVKFTCAGACNPATDTADEVANGSTAFYKIAGEGTIRIGGFIEITGSFDGSSLTGSIFVGAGPYRLDDGSVNPQAKGLVVTNVTGSLSRTAPNRTLTASGTVALVGIPGLTLTGTVNLSGNESGSGFVAGVLTFEVGGLSLNGTFGVAYSTANGLTFTLGTANTTATVPSGTTIQAVTLGLGELTSGHRPVELTIASATINVRPAGVVARISGLTVDLRIPGSTLQSLSGLLDLNTTAQDDATTGLRAGTVRVVLGSPTPVSLTVGGQVLRGPFAFEQVTVPPAANALPGTAATREIRVAATGVEVKLGQLDSGGAVVAGVHLTDGFGAVVLTASGMAARFGGNARLVVPGASVTGTLGFALNSGTTAVNTQVSLGTETVTLAVPAGPSYVRFEGTGLVIAIAGQMISADVVVERSSGVTTIRLAHVTASFGSATTPIVTLTDGHANLTLTDTGLVGSISGSLVLALAGVGLSGDLALKINTTANAVTVGPETYAKGFTFAGSNLRLTVGSQEFVVGRLVVSQTVDTTGAKVTTLGLTDAHLALDGVGTVDVSGDLVATAGGVAGRLTISTALTFGTASLSGDLRLTVNSSTQAAQIGSVRVPGGPYLRVEGSGLTLTVGSGFTVVGSFVVERAVSSTGAARTVLAVSGVEVRINGTAVLRDVSGALVMVPTVAATSTTPLRTGGPRRQLRGTVDLSGLLPASVQVAGTFELAVNQTTAAVRETVPVGTGSVVLDLPAGQFLRVAATGVTFSIGGQSLTGDLSIERTGTDHGPHRPRGQPPDAQARRRRGGPARGPRCLRPRRRPDGRHHRRHRAHGRARRAARRPAHPRGQHPRQRHLHRAERRASRRDADRRRRRRGPRALR